jgi:hypothetical protein
MGRPVEWSPLSGADPVPGEPDEVARIGRHYRSVADAIDRAAANLRKLANSGEAVVSKAVDALEENCEKVAEDISRAQERYRGVGDALVSYAPTLEQAQADSLRALALAQDAQADQQAATRRGEHASTPEEEQAAHRAADAASGNLAAARRLLDGAIADRDQAAQAAISAIKEVQDSGDLNDGWWDNWGHKIVEIIQKVASVVALVCGILALCVGWIPIIGQALAGILGTIALIASAISLVCNIALASTGYGSWGAVVWDAIAVASFGVGRVFSSAARGSTTAVRGATRLSAGKIQGAGGARIGSLLGGNSLAGISRNAARGRLTQGRMAGALTRANVWGSLRSLGPDFMRDFATLRVGANWSAARAGLAPAFRSIFTGGGLPALYGETALVQNQQLVSGLAPQVASHPLTAQAIAYTNATTAVAMGANVTGNFNDFRELADHLGLMDGPDFDLNVAVDPLVP